MICAKKLLELNNDALQQCHGKRWIVCAVAEYNTRNGQYSAVCLCFPLRFDDFAVCTFLWTFRGRSKHDFCYLQPKLLIITMQGEKGSGISP